MPIFIQGCALKQKKCVRESLKAAALFLPSALFSSKALGLKHFDDLDYTASPTVRHAPMDTLAALTDFGEQINHVYGITTIILVFVFFAVSIPLVYTIFKFKAPKEDMTDVPPPKQIHGNVALEFAWTLIPIILLLFIAVPTWEAIFKQPTKAPPGAMVIDVIGHQWWWEFYYPDLDIRTASELHIPAETPIFLNIWSDDVIHSFWIPKFGGKIDALPGKKNTLFFTSPKVMDQSVIGGEHYQGQCVELCGLSHALMRFEAVVHPKDQFDRWAKSHNNPPVVATELQKKGESIFMQCQSCHSIAGTPSGDIEKQMLAMDPPQKKLGPNLGNFGNRTTLGSGTRFNTAENLHDWIKRPEHIKPGSKMIGLGLSDDDIKAVAAYIRQSTAKVY